MIRIANPLSKAGFGSFAYDDAKIEIPRLEPVRALSISINDECNLKCGHCVERDFERGSGKYPLVLRNVSRLPDDYLEWLSVAGKEPTLTPDRLTEILEIGRRKAHTTILMTNGLMLTPELQKRLNGDLDYVDVSIDGSNTYKSPTPKLWDNLRYASNNGFKGTCVLTTTLKDSYRQIGELSKKIADDFQGKVNHSIGFYLGWPGDPRILLEEEIVDTIRQIADQYFKTIIQVPLSYSRYLKRIFQEFGVDMASKRFDSKTGIPSFDLNGHKLVAGSHLETPFYGLRTEIDGNVYFGCAHIMINGNSSRLAIGNLETEILEEVFQKVEDKKSDLVQNISGMHTRCKSSNCFEYCKGGDRMGGYIHTGIAKDAFCSGCN